jgi:hypothetical protein
MSFTGFQTGDQVTGKFSLTQGSKSGGADYVTAKGSFNGHIVAIAQTSFNPPTYIMTFEGGKVHETQRTSAHRTNVTAVHPPHNDATLLLTLDGAHNLVQGDATYNITKPHGGGALHLEFVPPPV